MAQGLFCISGLRHSRDGVYKHGCAAASSGPHADAAHIAESAEASLPDTQLLDSQPMLDDISDMESRL